jgi:hypothetical protein
MRDTLSGVCSPASSRSERLTARRLQAWSAVLAPRYARASNGVTPGPGRSPMTRLSISFAAQLGRRTRGKTRSSRTMRTWSSCISQPGRRASRKPGRRASRKPGRRASANLVVVHLANLVIVHLANLVVMHRANMVLVDRASLVRRAPLKPGRRAPRNWSGVEPRDATRSLYGVLSGAAWSAIPRAVCWYLSPADRGDQRCAASERSREQ